MTPDGGSMSIPQILWIEVSREMRHSYPGSQDPGIESGDTHPTDESSCALRHSLLVALPRPTGPGESMVVWQALPDPQGLRVTDPGSPSCG